MNPSVSNGPLKRLAAFHDISGVGRCALTVILPALSALGVQTIPVPTAVLSAHTGGFGDIAMVDLSTFTKQALDHYMRLNYTFDCIYTGFLASEKQMDTCIAYFDQWPDALKVVDPVMGDHGKPYRTYTSGMIHRMSGLVTYADIITPNITECGMLLNETLPSALTASEAKSLLVKLSKKGPRYVLVTGVPMVTNELYNLGYDREKDEFWRVRCNYAPVAYPGTGDLYTSVFLGSFLGGDSLPIAIERATRFLETAIYTTYSYGTDPKEGVLLEKCLPWLMMPHSFTDFSLF